jgi:phosphoglycolate phosphatase-like HAD superfamily hydrolase
MDAIVFDWDGTLCDSLAPIYAANRQVLAEYGLPFDDDRYRAAYAPDWRLMYQRLGISDADMDAAGRRWLELYSEAAEAGLFPRVQESLERLVAAGFVLGLVTAGDRDVVGSQLERFGIGQLITARIYGTDDIAAKPHPDPLLLALRDLDRAERVATARYVGDVPDDMRMARAVGATGIGIEGPMASASVLLEAGATAVYPYVADFVDELLEPQGAAAHVA